MKTLTPQMMGHRAMIATEHDLSAAAGARIFNRGGNAIDAAVAAVLVEGIVNPHMFTIGGETPMLVYAAKARRVVAINGNMTAPARATIAAYRERGLDAVPDQGLLAAGVPAAFDGLITVLASFGTMSLGEVAEPALELCEEGFPVHPGLIGFEASQVKGGPAVNSHIGPLCLNAERFLKQWPTSAALWLPDKKLPAVGTLIKNPALASCFRRLLDAEAGARSRGREEALAAVRDRFYRGDIAREIGAWSERHNGLLQASDLAGFATRIEEPVSVDYRGYTVYKCGPWCQGPVFLQHLRLLEGVNLRAMDHNSVDYVHFMIETAKLAYADREAYYGDPEFTRVPMKELLSPAYAELRRALVDPRRASLDLRPGDPIAMRPLGSLPSGIRPWGAGTVHVDAADREGNLIAITASGGWLQSSPVIDTLGFPLGSRMQTFYLDERHPNALVPGKRPRTTLTPSIAARDGVPFIAFGTMGGDQQDQWTVQFFVNLVDFGMEIQEAIEAPKFSSRHFPSTFAPHDASPGVLKIEDRIEPRVRDELAARGHRVEVGPAYSEGYVLAAAIDRERGVLIGGADPRGYLTGIFPARAIGW
ncbi:MAG TPA: gamma-glutamyltransferase family protein [Candidatus Binataceae bacterium]|nr:gamma-glutamyltransferase family protein [Candidatus Binataceae bacterium]